jgi:hypothetical protein
MLKLPYAKSCPELMSWFMWNPCYRRIEWDIQERISEVKHVLVHLECYHENMVEAELLMITIYSKRSGE